MRNKSDNQKDHLFFKMRDEKKLREELEEVKGMPNVMIEFPNEEDITNFIVALKVNEGLYRNHWFQYQKNGPIVHQLFASKTESGIQTLNAFKILMLKDA